MSVQDVISQMMDRVVITDDRMQGKVKYPLLPTIFAIIIAWCGGCNSCKSVELYWLSHLVKLRELVPGLPDHCISHDTVNRLLRTIRFEEFHTFLHEFVNRVVEADPNFVQKGLRVLALDGQTPRALEYEPKPTSLGKKPDDKRLYDRLYYVTLQDTTNGLSLALDKVNDKENENKACVRLLSMFDISDTVVTADALNTQRPVAKAIIEHHGDYCLALKDNHKSLCKAVKEAFHNPDLEEYMEYYETSYEKAHGRIEKRIVKALPADVIKKRISGDWATDCHTIFLAETQSIIVKYDYDREPEVRLFLSSINFDTPEIASLGYRIIRSHWGIENGLHHVLDIDFGQDFMQTKNRNFANNVELLDRIALNVVRVLQPQLQRGAQPVSIRGVRQCLNADPALAVHGLICYLNPV